MTDVRNISAALETMERIGMVLCVHGEVTDPAVDVFDREAVFIARVLEPLTRDFPGLKIVLEHITTVDAADFVASAGPEYRGDGHPASSAHQPQRPVRRGPAPASLLPAGGQARSAPACGARSGDLGLAQILPRHRQRPACAARQGIRPAAAPASSMPRSRSKAMRKRSTRRARSTASRPSRRCMARPFTDCRPMRGR